MSEAHHEIENLRAPPGANMIAFGALLALSTIFLFTSYCMARALVGGFGTHLGTIAACVLACGRPWVRGRILTLPRSGRDALPRVRGMPTASVAAG